MKKEEWRPVVGFEGLYEVSSLGRVKSTERTICVAGHSKQKTRTIKEKILYQKTNKPSGGEHKRSMVSLWKENREYTKMVSRLVAEAFIPNPLRMECVLHLDDNATNNKVENLQWGSREENVRQAVERERMKFGDNHHSSVLTMKQRLEILELIGDGIPVTQIASYYGVKHQVVSDIKNKKTKVSVLC